MTQKLVSARETMNTVRGNDFSFRKKYGQNFLVNEHVLESIIEASRVCSDDCVLEIGPGIGTLTQAIAKKAGRVIAVEIDPKLIPILDKTLAGYDNVTVKNADILKTDIRALADEYKGDMDLKVVANLPYYITTPVIMHLLESGVSLESITVMVQKEVAERMQAAPSTKEYGALSLAVQYRAKVRIAAEVPPESFIPRPKVGSAVVFMDCSFGPTVEVKDEKLLFALIRACFNQRRKTLANAVKNAPGLSFSREDIEAVLNKMQLSPTVRGEALSLEQFAKLADELTEK